MARAHFLVGRIRREPAGITHGRGHDSRDLPELAFRAPETAEPEHGLFEATHGRLLDVAAIHEVPARQRQWGIAARKGLALGRHGGFLGKECHEGLLVSRDWTRSVGAWERVLNC